MAVPMRTAFKLVLLNKLIDRLSVDIQKLCDLIHSVGETLVSRAVFRIIFVLFFIR